MKKKIFLALWPDHALRKRIDVVAKKNIESSGKPTPASNLHITLVFIGYVSAAKLECVKQFIETVKIAPFEIKIDSVGSFGNKVLWLGCSQIPDSLSELRHLLVKGLHECCQNQPEERTYTPHITIQRKIAKAIPTKTKLETPIIWSVDSISLILSEQDQGNPVYSELASRTTNL